jgi:hypothetical protein
VRSLPDGSKEQYYKYQNSAFDLGYRCFLVKNDQVVASALTRVAGIWEKGREIMGVPVRYVREKESRSIADVEKTWGRPVHVKKLPDGTEERYYQYGNTMMTDLMAMFLFKDGKLIATAVAN